MAKTLLYPISADGDVRLRMGGNTLCRAFDFGAWTKIRVGIRLAFQDAGASLTSTPRLALGICSGTTNPYNNGAGVTTNFVGMISDLATWNRTATIYQLATNATDIRSCKRVGTTLTLGPGLKSGGQGQFAFAPSTKRELLFLDIEKGSPNYSLRLFFPSNDSVIVDQSAASFLTQMALATPSVTGHIFDAAAAIATDETAGAFNAMNLSWDRAIPILYVSDLAVARLA